MGIQSLLPFLSNSTKDTHINEFENEFVAIDAYCWLHKGIYSCAVEIAMKISTTKYITYCMRYIDMLLYFKVKPILVFDGKKLKSKEETEKKRREERNSKYNKGIELIKAGKMSEGRKLLGESVDVSHELAVNLMKECRKKNIDCIVAPYEADAQLAYLSINNIVKCVVTEDSDLLVYGCEKVMFKMDTNGRGKLVEKNQLHLSLGIEAEEFSEEKFRYMCILSGCDYLPSLPSIGPANALKFIKMLNKKNIYEVLPKLPIYLNKLKITVTQEYINKFKIADNTFKHQIIYDPFQRIEKPLRPVCDENSIIGEKLPEDLAFQLAIGNMDPISMKILDNYDPDKFGTGFTLLWKQDNLPNAISRRNFFTSSHEFDIKKRQRENSDSDSVLPITNDLKKHCFFQTIPKTKSTNAKKTADKISNSAFIFEPKVQDVKKVVLKPEDESNLLTSRYFFGKNKKQENKSKNSVIDRRKDETSEGYLQRLYEEYFPDSEAQRASCCSREKESDDFCASCKNCDKCCQCAKKENKIFQTQYFSECLAKLQQIKKKKNIEEQNHSLLDEIYKTEEKKTEVSEELNSSGSDAEESRKTNFTLNLSHIFPNTNGIEKSEPVRMELAAEKENEEKEKVEESEIEMDSPPSPVFKVSKESKLLYSNNLLKNVSDTAATPTSIYFSASSSSKTFQRSNSMLTPKTPTPTFRSLKSCKSVPAKMGKGIGRNCSAHRTLFQFGFQKMSKEGCEKEAIVEDAT